VRLSRTERDMKRVKLHPRTRNRFEYDGLPIVAKAPHRNGDSLRRSVERAVGLLGGLDRIVGRGDRVLIKPNFNCEFEIPLSTDVAFLCAVIEHLQALGARVKVGEMSGRAAGPTERVVRLLGVEPALKRYGVPFVDFEKDERLELEVDGAWWDVLHVPRTIYEAEKRIYLTNMRGHSTGRYTAALKLSVGWISAEDREILHEDRENVGRKIPELNLGWQPDLVLIDGRRSTVSWHGRGDYVYPNVIMAAGDMVAIDAEAVRILKSYPADNRLDLPLEEIEQICGSVALGLGSIESVVMEAEPNASTEHPDINPRELAAYPKGEGGCGCDDKDDE